MTATALANLIDQHGASLVLFAQQFGTHGEDLVQDALLQLVQQRKPPQDPLAWLYHTVRHRAISVWRSNRRRELREQRHQETILPYVQPMGPDILDQQLALQQLEQLPIEQREIIVAHLWGGLTFEQLAHVFSSSPATLHRRYHAALQVLRERLDRSLPTEAPP